jgi:hypothetical protein
MSTPRILLSAFGACACLLAAFSYTDPRATLSAQAKPGNPITGEGLPNPTTKVIRNWGELPAGRKWGTSAGVDIDPKDGHVWAYAAPPEPPAADRWTARTTLSIRSSSSIATPGRCWRTSARG